MARGERRGRIVEAGWAIWYAFGSDERGEYLDYDASHKMMGEDEHTRIREDGSVEVLDGTSLERLASDPEEDVRFEAKHEEALPEGGI